MSDNGAVILRALLTVVGFVCLSLLGGQPVSAHTEAELVEPANGSHLRTLPGEVRIRTGGAVVSAQIVMTTPDARVRRLSATLHGREVTAALPSTGVRGEYDVAYRLVAADGHASTGATRFTVEQGAEPDFETVSEASRSVDVPVLGLAVGAGVLFVVGVMLVLAKVRR